MNPHARAARRITGALFINQSLGSAGVIATATVASIVGAELTGRSSLAGVPAATVQLGTALMALFWALMSDRIGRRAALALGTAAGALGALLAGGAVATGAFGLLLPALLIMGSGNAAMNLGRFTAAEVSPGARRGRAVATVVLGGTVGSVLGPILVAPTARLATSLGLPELTGPFGAALFAFILGTLVLAGGLRPEPKLLALELERQHDVDEALAGRSPTPPRPARPWRELLRDPRVVTAVSAMVIAHGVMAALMGITSLHMRDHSHALTTISAVVSAHTLGMFALSVVSGWLTDRLGRVPVIAIGIMVLLTSCVTAPLSPQLVPLMASLFALGLGWNLCFVAGSALLSDSLTAAEKARMQGTNDLLVGATAASASLLSGLGYASIGYGAMGIGGAVAVTVLAGIVVWGARERLRRGAPAGA